MLLVRICLGPARGRFAGSGGFGFRILDFEFVWDFDIGISDFPFWLRPQAALRVRVGGPPAMCDRAGSVFRHPRALARLDPSAPSHHRECWSSWI